MSERRVTHAEEAENARVLDDPDAVAFRVDGGELVCPGCAADAAIVERGADVDELADLRWPDRDGARQIIVTCHSCGDEIL